MAAPAASTNEKDPPAGPKARGVLIPIVAASVLSAALAGGVAWFAGGRHAGTPAKAEAAPTGASADGPAAAAARKPEVYLPLSPSFTVNLGDAESGHFLQTDIQVQVHSDAEAELVKAQAPRIRNAILMLLSQQKMADLMTREGKEALQKRLLDETQKILGEETGKPVVDALYFTSFVMQ